MPLASPLEGFRKGATRGLLAMKFSNTSKKSKPRARDVRAKFYRPVDLHSLESNVLKKNIGHDILMPFPTLNTFRNIQLLLPA